MTNSESLAVAEKLMVLLGEAAGMGMMASLNLETRNGMISTTFRCEELRVPDGKPSSNAGNKKNKSNGSSKRSKERLLKYQEGKQKDIEIIKDWRKNNFVDREKVKPAEQQSEVTKEKEITAESVLVCKKCNYKCTRTETLAKHMKSNHEINEIFKCENCGKNYPSKNDLKEHIEIHRLEENVKQDIWCNPNYSAKEQNEAFDEFIKECQKDLLDDSEDDEIYSESKSND